MSDRAREIPLCDLCGTREAEYVCKGCGRLVCRVDFDYSTGLCRSCSEDFKPLVQVEGDIFRDMILPTIFIFLGFILIFIGFILLSTPYLGAIPGNGGDFIVVIGPLPILLTGQIGLLAAVIYLVFMIIVIYLLFKWFLK
jgi:uncharacterized membrane protein